MLTRLRDDSCTGRGEQKRTPRVQFHRLIFFARRWCKVNYDYYLGLQATLNSLTTHNDENQIIFVVGLQLLFFAFAFFAQNGIGSEQCTNRFRTADTLSTLQHDVVPRAPQIGLCSIMNSLVGRRKWHASCWPIHGSFQREPFCEHPSCNSQ